MQVEFHVHAASDVPMQMPVTIGGQTVQAVVSGYSIELVSTDGTMSQLLRFLPTDTELLDYRARFTPGTRVLADYTTPDYVAPAPAPAA